ncbi:HAD domain-containing protein [Micromonospora sp. NPDC049559]|uniref:HAD domain-containing protein n=1 Tax=Micromonospora sp. NPDC049559 TaxID=3155923 RepID=UPI00343F2356
MIFLDIDGVLIPLRARPAGAARQLSSGTRHTTDRSGNPLLDRLDPDDGRRLLALPGDLVWASTWLAEANEVVAPRLDLPVLPVVDWPDADEEPPRGVHWKTALLTRWAAGLPFVWLDDEITDADRRWVAARHPRPALLHRVDPYLGLTDSDLTAVHRWLEPADHGVAATTARDRSAAIRTAITPSAVPTT